MPFSDDELPPAISSVSGSGLRIAAERERVLLVAHSNATAPLEAHRQQVLLELIDTSSSSAAERAGLDLVAVLDVSWSMQGEKLKKLKTAMKFVISKLGPMDRLSIVSFSDDAKMLCPLRYMTAECQQQLIKEIVEEKLVADNNTNMRDGLETGLKVLAGRRHRSGRVASIIFMSDGQQNRGGDAGAVQIDDHDVAVYTFGFGADQGAKVLEAIAGNSHGGTYYDVKDGENLSVHFSALLAGLLSVVVQDLELTVWEQPDHSNIEKVDPGSYPTIAPDDGGRSPVTVRFGELYRGEVRKVMVDLLLPAVGRGYSATVLKAQCTYSIYLPSDPTRPHHSTPHGRASSGVLGCVIRRSRSAIAGAMDTEVKVERIRRFQEQVIGEAAATNDPERAYGLLREADEALDVERSKSRHPLLDMLKTELAKLLELAKGSWNELFAALLASKRSHQQQRYGSIGDVDVDLYKTSPMSEYVRQATAFEKDPSRPPPSVEDDVRLREEAERRRKRNSRVWGAPDERRRTSGLWAWAAVLLCTALAVAVILAGTAVFAVFLLYRPRTPYLAVSDARLEQLQYGQGGAIDYLQVSITVLAVNNNSKTDASFPAVDLAVGFNGDDVALLRAQPFVVARKSSLPLQYDVVSAGRALDPAGMQAMDEALKAGVVPFDLFGKARTRWKVGVFARLRFWTRLSCRLRFFFPGNGTVMPADRDKCRSRSP
ncbi:hypothetical protein BS78_K122300 [Paspalum vaginatum]|uniref:VWFA domain-containing protein n=1 Tax=Paspalum vaginatum TaxID=158149 RepID=A0A9W7XBP6_9POAL|nr:hypothetical protein BS78_K122300 [Paspalum vaginatum]